jgi:hypothetical protein
MSGYDREAGDYTSRCLAGIRSSSTDDYAATCPVMIEMPAYGVIGATTTPQDVRL